MSLFRGLARVWPVLVALTVAVLAAAAAPAAAGGRSAADSCPPPFPADQLTSGQRLWGQTVDEGTTPSLFRARVIGVLPDAIAPGLDLVLVDTSSPAIDEVGGVWAGMSGSPVYARDGRLVGAIAYGLAAGASPVAGITPAEAMYDLTAAGAGKGSVDLPAATERDLVDSGLATQGQAASGLEALPVPIGISGLSVGAAQRFGDLIGSSIDLSNAFVTGSAEATLPVTAIEPGSNAAAALSYGDYTAAAVGTATAVCGKEVLLFGHPLNFDGETMLSLHTAEALYVQQDLFVPFKVATPGGVVGAITQDRLSGLSGTFGVTPDTAPVTTTLTDVGTGAVLAGRTDVVAARYLPDLAAFHTVASAQRVLGSLGGGVAQITWTATGSTSTGSPWQVSRSDVVAAESDLPFVTGFEMYSPLSQIQQFPRDETSIESVDVTASLDETYQAFEISKVEVRVGKTWVALGGPTLPQVRAGRPVTLRVTGYPWRSSTPIQSELRLPPATPGFLFVTVRGRGAADPVDEPLPGNDIAALDDLLSQIASEPRGDDLIVDWNSEQASGVVTKRLSQFVTGEVFGEIEVL